MRINYNKTEFKIKKLNMFIELKINMTKVKLNLSGDLNHNQ